VASIYGNGNGNGNGRELKFGEEEVRSVLVLVLVLGVADFLLVLLLKVGSFLPYKEGFEVFFLVGDGDDGIGDRRWDGMFGMMSVALF